MAADAQKLLIAVILADRRDQYPARRKPVYEGWRDLPRRGCDDHSVVRRLFGPTLCPVTASANDVAQVQFAESALGITQQLAMPLDREDPAAEAGEDRGLIP